MRLLLALACTMSLTACDAATPDTADAAFADARRSASFTCDATATPLADGSILFEGTLSVSTQTTGNPEGIRTVERWILTGRPAGEVSTTMDGNPEGFTCDGTGTATRERGRIEVEIQTGNVSIRNLPIELTDGTFTEVRGRRR